MLPYIKWYGLAAKHYSTHQDWMFTKNVFLPSSWSQFCLLASMCFQPRLSDFLHIWSRLLHLTQMCRLYWRRRHKVQCTFESKMPGGLEFSGGTKHSFNKETGICVYEQPWTPKGPLCVTESLHLSWQHQRIPCRSGWAAWGAAYVKRTICIALVALGLCYSGCIHTRKPVTHMLGK